MFCLEASVRKTFPPSSSHLTYTFGEDSMSQAVGSRILVVSPTTEEQGSERGLSATVSSSLRSCGLSPEVVPETAELELEEFACVVYVGSDHEVSGEALMF